MWKKWRWSSEELGRKVEIVNSDSEIVEMGTDFYEVVDGLENEALKNDVCLTFDRNHLVLYHVQFFGSSCSFDHLCVYLLLFLQNISGDCSSLLL